ncbi:hypothetical protein AUP68_10358 [Ilyonectria robusta]
MIWYQENTTWGIGIISASINDIHEIMPLGHSLMKQNTITRLNREIRPLYTLGIPPVSTYFKEKLFDQIPWESMFKEVTYGSNKYDSLTLNASKMAASKVDHSYSLWTKLSEDSKTVTYRGGFFGAERFAIGDTLRLRWVPTEWQVSAGRYVLGLQSIFTTTDKPGHVFFHGHIYHPAKGDTDPLDVVNEEHLPITLRDEIRWRNSIAPSDNWRWVLVKDNAVFKERAIAGRFYTTENLELWNAVEQSRTDKQRSLLNGRMDMYGAYLGRKANRLDALEASVHPEARFTAEIYIIQDAVNDPLPISQNIKHTAHNEARKEQHMKRMRTEGAKGAKEDDERRQTKRMRIEKPKRAEEH